MKRLFMLLMCFLAVMMASLSAKAQDITITLLPGWTWIGYPKAEAMDIPTALGDFVPMEGDIIKSQFSSTSYINGQWRGRLMQFTPGMGYHYYSMRGEPTTLVFASSTPQSQVQVTTSEPMLITAISAMGGGEVTTTDGTYIIVKGLCWATHENPTTNDDFYEEAESGVGTFSISMTELNIATLYYVRAYAVTPNGTVYGNEKTFTTRDGIPTLTTAEITNLTCESVTCGGEITDNGGLNVTARGVCWSTNPTPTINDSHTTNGTGTGSFTNSITDLEVSTTYYVRAYATTNVCTSYGNEVSFTTPSGIPEVVTNPVTDIYGDGATMGCTVADDGGFVVDQENGWCRIGVCWSTSPNPTTSDYIAYIDNLVDWWYYQSINNDFTAYRTGLSLSTTYYVRAYAQTRFGTSYGNEVSFTTPAPLWSNGVLPGEFSVSENQQIHFSRGNLQYRASTNTWRFALNQWSFVGGTQIIEEEYGNYITEVHGNVYTESGAKCDNAEVSSTYSGWIDLFGWSTSGNNHGAYCYQPWSISENVSDYYAYGNSSYNLYDQTGQADWGSNAISNGGTQPNLWRTLTQPEWDYVFNTRSTASGIRYAKAIVCNTKGVILLPDDWDPSYFSLNNTNKSGASFSSNTITTEQWSILEQHGAVFLCETGRRHRYTYHSPCYGCGDDEPEHDDPEMYGFYVGEAYYWSSSYKNNSNAWLLSIKASGVNPQNYALRHKGMAVRLVYSASQSPIYTISVLSNPSEGGTVSGGGSYQEGQSCTLTATANAGYTFTNWTEDGEVVSSDDIYSFTVNGNRILVANFSGGSDHEYVDLGLPSGTLWATCNVGAETPEDYGDYFAWGETQPKSTYDWSTYQYCNGSENSLTKYCNNSSYGYNGFTDNLTNLLPEDDAATANWGAGWRMPTKEEWQELYNNTTCTWTTQNGVNGRLFTASNGNSLFLPAAGCRYYSGLSYAGSSGSYWSSSLSTDYPSRAWYFWVYSDSCDVHNSVREWGPSVRAVRSSGQN